MGKLSTHQRRARDFLQREDWDSALSELEHVLGLDASNPAVHNQMGDVHLRKHAVNTACEHFEKAVDLYAGHALHNNAVALCRKVIRLCPSRLEVRYKLARIRLDQGLRADAAQLFTEYVDQVTPESEDVGEKLETRCREILDALGDAAQVGPIVAKLEETSSFVCALEIVSRCAQRAADAGNDDAARRYMEKMRSLRVLVERRGGAAESPAELELPPAALAVAPVAPREIAAREIAPREIAAREIAPREIAAQEVAAREIVDEDLSLSSIELMADDLVVELALPSAPAAEPQSERLLDLELDTTPPTPRARSWADMLSIDPGAPAVAAPARAPAPILEAQEPRAKWSAPAASIGPTSTPAATPPDVPRTSPAPAAQPDEIPEYEQAETSLEEVASLLQRVDFDWDSSPPVETWTESAPTADGDETPELSHTSDYDEVVETPSLGRIEFPESRFPGTRAELASAARHPSPVPTVPVHGLGSDLHRAPVWIPDASDANEDPTPSGGGQTHELEQVIDTFREQMSQALGDDGAARYDLGVAYFEMGLYNEALAEFEVALCCSGFEEQSLEMTVACLLRQARHPEVVELLEARLAEDTGARGLGLHYGLGTAYEALGAKTQARRQFEHVARIDPSFGDVSARLIGA